jgi:hypothetical protein
MTNYRYFDDITQNALNTIFQNMNNPNLERFEAGLTQFVDIFSQSFNQARQSAYYVNGADVEIVFDNGDLVTHFVVGRWVWEPIGFILDIYFNEYFPSNVWTNRVSFRTWMDQQKNKRLILLDNKQYDGSYLQIFNNVLSDLRSKDPDPSIPIYPHDFLSKILTVAASEPLAASGTIGGTPSPAPAPLGPAPAPGPSPTNSVSCRYHIKVQNVFSTEYGKKNVNNFQVPVCGLNIALFRCCDPNKSIEQLIGKVYFSDTAWKVDACPNGDLSSGVGKLSYTHYYEVEDIVRKFYTDLANSATPGSDPLNPTLIIDELTNLLNSGKTIFVENYADICNGPTQTRQTTFGIGVLPKLSDKQRNMSLTVRGKNYIPFNEYELLTPMSITEHLFQGFRTYLGTGASIEQSSSPSLSTYTGTHKQNPDTRFFGLNGLGCSGTVTNCPQNVTPAPTGPCSDEFNWSIILEKVEPDGDSAYLDYPILKGKVTKTAGFPGGEFVKDASGRSVVYSDIMEKGWSNSPYVVNNIVDYVPLANLDPVNAVVIPGQNCLRGLEKNYQIRATRLRKYKIKIVCSELTAGPNGSLTRREVEIDYKNPSSKAYNFLRTKLVSNTTPPKAPDVVWTDVGNGLSIFAGAFNLGYVKDSAQVDGFARTEDGYFYTFQTEKIPIIDPSTGRFKAYENISYDKSNTSCLPQKISEFLAWRLDLTNPCGCQEAEIFNNYLVYPGQEYTHPFMLLNGASMVTTFESVRDLNVIDFPEPPPATNRYNLRAGQSVGTNVREKPDCISQPEKTLHPFLFGADVLTGVKKNTIYGLFNYSQSLECYLTSSDQSAESKEYYYQVTDCDSCNRSPYFALTYGHWQGSGSIASAYEASDSPTKAIYSQYRLLSLDGDQKQFVTYTNGTASNSNDVYVINFYSEGLSDKLDIGNFEINLAELNGTAYSNNFYTGSNVAVSSSNKILRLIDNSNEIDDPETCADDPFYTYDIVSGSLNDGTHISGTGSLSLRNPHLTTYGQVYPNLGFIILDASKLNDYLSFNTVTGSNIHGDNSYKFFTAISGANNLNHPMKARNVKQRTTNHYFIRVKSGDSNYSNNPTYVKENANEKGRIKNHCFYNDPMTYITTVGLYNNERELLAIAKLSKPIKKTRANDILIKIRLNW